MVLSRSTSRTSQKKNSFVFQYSAFQVSLARRQPVRKERPGIPAMGNGKQLPGYRVLQRLSRPRGSRHSSPAGRSQVTTGHCLKAVVSLGHEPRTNRRYELAKETKTEAAPAKEGGGLLRRLLDRRRQKTQRLMGIQGPRKCPRSTSRTFKASSSAVTECRWCGISC